jgi:hypothetical protein
MDNYYESWSIPKLAKSILESVKDGQPWSLTFAPTANLTSEEKQKLQHYLKHSFEIWAKSWIIPQAEAIIAKTNKYKGGNDG